MTVISGIRLEASSWPLGKVVLSPLVAPLVAVVARESANAPYLSPVDLSRNGVETLLVCQPVIAIEQRGMCECLCGLRTLQAARTHFASTEVIPIQIIKKPTPSDEQLFQLAKADLYLKSLSNMFLREPVVLAAAYDVLGKQLIKMIAPGHQSKGQFAQDAGYSRQIFYQKLKSNES